MANTVLVLKQQLLWVSRKQVVREFGQKQTFLTQHNLFPPQTHFTDRRKSSLSLHLALRSRSDPTDPETATDHKEKPTQANQEPLLTRCSGGRRSRSWGESSKCWSNAVSVGQAAKALKSSSIPETRKCRWSWATARLWRTQRKPFEAFERSTTLRLWQKDRDVDSSSKYC